MEITHLITNLREIAAETVDVPSRVKAFLTAYWLADDRGEIPDVGARWDLLGDLAMDLEYFEPNPDWRSEEECFFGEEAVRRVLETLRALEQLHDN